MPPTKTVALDPAVAVPQLTRSEASAIKALFQGNADEHAQQIATGWIVKKLCGIGSVSFRPGDPYSSAMLEGRRFVGVQLIHIATEPMSTLKVKNEPTSRSD